VGQPLTDEFYEDENYFSEKPDWFSREKIAYSFDESKMTDQKRMALATVLVEAKDIKKDEIIELTTSFLPVPGIDRMKSMGYSVWAVKEGDDLVKSYFLKN